MHPPPPHHTTPCLPSPELLRGRVRVSPNHAAAELAVAVVRPGAGRPGVDGGLDCFLGLLDRTRRGLLPTSARRGPSGPLLLLFPVFPSALLHNAPEAPELALLDLGLLLKLPPALLCLGCSLLRRVTLLPGLLLGPERLRLGVLWERTRAAAGMGSGGQRRGRNKGRGRTGGRQ